MMCKALASQVLKTSRHGDCATSLCSPTNTLAVLMVKKDFFPQVSCRIYLFHFITTTTYTQCTSLKCLALPSWILIGTCRCYKFHCSHPFPGMNQPGSLSLYLQGKQPNPDHSGGPSLS